MRITTNMADAAALRGQLRSVKSMTDAARVASTGERVNAPSDDPVSWSSAARHDARIARLDNRNRTMERASGDLDLAERTLASAGDLLQSAREIATRAANGTMDAATRADLAKQVDGIRSSLLAMANTRGTSGYLFGGTRTDAPPFDATGAFVGNDTEVRIEVADGVTARANASGAQAFTTAGGRDLFADLQTLSTALTANDLSTIQTSIASVASGYQQLTTAGVTVGLGVERFQSATAVTNNALLSMRSSRANEVEADLATALSNLTTTRGAYERSISITREILQVSAVQR